MNPRERGQKLIAAIVEGKDEVARDILKKEVDFMAEERGDNAIHLLARKGNLKIIKLMKNRKANLEQRNLNGNVALHYAARGGYMDLVRYLRQEKVDMNIENSDGETPLQMAVAMQTMDVIEELIEVGMDPNKRNKKTGETALHVALKYGRQEAMEGLLICAANPELKDNDGKKPEDVAKNAEIRESIRMNKAFLIALKSGYIMAKGLKITRDWVSEPRIIDRVGVILENCDIPVEFPSNFYCRREKSENATVVLKHYNDEHVFSDVFYIRLSDVGRECATKIYLPLYMPPSEKEQLVLRFVNGPEEDRPVDDYVTKDKINYCLLETILVPETTYVCTINIRPKMEENAVGEFSKVITSEMEPKFSIDIPANAFDEKTIINLMVFETNNDDFISGDDSSPNASISNNETPVLADTDTQVENTSDGRSNSTESSSPKQPSHSPLLSDIYQINLQGQQPQKGVAMQIPMCEGKERLEDVVIVSADETKLHLDDQLEIVTAQPSIVNCNITFEASHFCIYVAVPKEKVATPEDLYVLQRQISSARERRKPGTFFVVVKQIEGFLHNIVVDCGVAIKTEDRLEKWIKKDYEKQDQRESEAIMMLPEDTFFVDVKGNARLESQSDSTQRKLSFSKCRASIQPYNILLDENVKKEVDGHAVVIINKKVDNGVNEVARLPIKLHVPPPAIPALARPELKSEILERSRHESTTSAVKARRYGVNQGRRSSYAKAKELYGKDNVKKEKSSKKK